MTTTAPITRKAMPRDIDVVIDIRADGWYNTYLFDPATGKVAPADADDPRSNRTREWLTAAAIGSDREQLFVAETNGEVVGVVDIRINEVRNEMHSFYMRKDKRRQGIGSQLMKTALQWLVDHGPDNELHIHLSEFNVCLVPFYERLGFVVTNSRTGNWWGRNKAGDQIIFDISMVSPTAIDVLDRLR